MKKIPSLFVMTEDHKITKEVNPLCQWVIDGEGKPTAKLDGTACAVIKGKLYKRYDNSKLISQFERAQKTAPLEDWIHCEDFSDRGKFIYWSPVTSKDYYHQIAWGWAQGYLSDGTYELVGPEINANPHSYGNNLLIEHGSSPLNESLLHHYCNSYHNPRTFEDIKRFLEKTTWEGIVWHHKDGRMCKITKKKFGFPWPMKVNNV